MDGAVDDEAAKWVGAAGHEVSELPVCGMGAKLVHVELYLNGHT